MFRLAVKIGVEEINPQRLFLVRVVGLEPTRLTAEEPKSSESTISTIPADMSGRDTCSYFVVLCFYTARETVAERNA